MKQSQDLIFLPLGGCNEIGMNLNLYGYDRKWLMVDLGITFNNDFGIDILMPDISFIQKDLKNLLGLVITHGHEDHIGAIPHLWSSLQCPIYATPFTAFLIREKLREKGLLKQAIIHEISSTERFQLGPFGIEYIPITHSIPESHVLKIETPKGVIVHTGDWKIDNDPLIGHKTDEKRLKKIGDEGVLALVGDSTNIFEEGDSESEAKVRDSLIKITKPLQNRVVIACFASNVARLATCYAAAQESNRKLVLVGRSLERMDQAARYAGHFKDMPKFLREEAAMELKPHEVLMVCTGSQGEPRSALARIADGSHPRVRLSPEDTVIFSSRMIPGNEDAIHAVQNKLADRGIYVITDDEEFTHVSGHPYQGDLRRMYQWIRPKIMVPVHGEPAHLREHAAFALNEGIPFAIVPKNGLKIKLDENGPAVVGQVEVGEWGLDGDVLVPMSGRLIKERKALSTNGIIFVTLELTPQRYLKHEPHVSLVGLCDEHDYDDLQRDVIRAIEHSMDNMVSKKMPKADDIREAIRQAVRRVLKGTRSKKPLVVTHVITARAEGKSS